MKSEALWLSVSPHLARFDQRLLLGLSRTYRVAWWEYSQSPDQPCCFDTAIVLLHDFLKAKDRPLHLIGHGLSGVVAWIYASQYPERVKSLTLLSVGENPVITWHAHYYALRQLLPCGRGMLLAQMVRLLFGPQTPCMTSALVERLQLELDTSLTLQSLAHQTQWSVSSIKPPMLICNGAADVITGNSIASEMPHWLKAGDRCWVCPEGRHFFHYEYPQRVAEQIQDHWDSVRLRAPTAVNAQLV